MFNRMIIVAALFAASTTSANAALTDCTDGSFAGTYVGQYTVNSIEKSNSNKDKDKGEYVIPSAVVSVALISNGAGTLTKVQVQSSTAGVDQPVLEYFGVDYTFDADLCQVAFPLTVGYVDVDVVLNLRARNGVTGIAGNAQGRINMPSYEMTVPLVLQRDLQARW
jgi:hypothetical protein